ncbi:MAG: hypothetical protein A3G24_04835 [Betaproteobacteria bacterium RIFCSPLOWO2_12_FULL_62_13]|nr:MAG: hypothetical protein A3G24_04835 [Betaproteobacteria bacterium RIFCSPLOWO2_12_FULL_62_13]
MSEANCFIILLTNRATLVRALRRDMADVWALDQIILCRRDGTDGAVANVLAMRGACRVDVDLSGL